MKQTKQNFKAEPIKERPNLKEVIKVLETLRNLHSTSKSEEIQKLIKLLIRNTLYFVSERRQSNYISQEAKRLWKKYAKESDLSNLTVQKQRSNKKNYPFLKDIILEHCNPLSILVNDILEKKKSIDTILKNELITAWITTEENNRLNQKCKSKRPNGWEHCYKQVGIKLSKSTSTRCRATPLL